MMIILVLASSLRLDYLPKSRWSSFRTRRGLASMIPRLSITLLEKNELMRSLEKFVGIGVCSFPKKNRVDQPEPEGSPSDIPNIDRIEALDSHHRPVIQCTTTPATQGRKDSYVPKTHEEITLISMTFHSRLVGYEKNAISSSPPITKPNVQYRV
ncbi:hypothetical protein Tco_0448776 [Tanacetum coccineum]